jgi:hypothetical protein
MYRDGVSDFGLSAARRTPRTRSSTRFLRVLSVLCVQSCGGHEPPLSSAAYAAARAPSRNSSRALTAVSGKSENIRQHLGRKTASPPRPGCRRRFGRDSVTRCGTSKHLTVPPRRSRSRIDFSARPSRSALPRLLSVTTCLVSPRWTWRRCWPPWSRGSRACPVAGDPGIATCRRAGRVGGKGAGAGRIAAASVQGTGVERPGGRCV